MNKVTLGVIIAFIGTALYIMHGSAAPGQRLGDADGLGSDDDANARYNYELMQLRDPATGEIPANIRARELAYASTLPSDGHLPAAKSTSAGWQPRGPWNVGGRTRAFGIDVTNEKNFVAGSCSGGMWRSTDGGLSWQQTSRSDTCRSVSCLAQDTRAGHQNVWYYGSGEAYGASASAASTPFGTGAFYLGDGIYKSTDSGKTWTVLPATKGPHLTTLDSWGDLVWNIAVNAADLVNDAVYAAVYGAVYKSLDGGTTWTSVLGTFGSSYFTDVAISRTGIVYASLSSDGGSAGLYRSADGITFTNITPSNFPAKYNRVKIGISPSNPEQVYFLGNTPGYGIPDTNYLGSVEWNSLWRYTYLSGDGSGTGGSWQDRSANLPATGGLFDKFSCQGSYDLVVKVKPNDTNVVFIGGTNLYRSNTAFADNSHTAYIGGYQQGASLPVVNEYINHHPDQHELAFFPSDPNKMISTNDGGIFYTNDNTVPSCLWTPLNNGYITTMFYTCAIDHATNDNIVIGGAQDNGSWFTNSTNLYSPWVTPRGGDGSFCAIADSGKAFYFSIQNGRIMRANLDGSGTILNFARIDPIGADGYLFVAPFVIDPNNNNLMYLAGGNSLWRNNNLSGIPYASNWDSISTNWIRFPDSSFAGGLSTSAITAVTASKFPANRVYIGTMNGKVFRIDSANTVTTITHNITSVTGANTFPSGAYVNCIAVDPTNADNVMVVFSNYNIYSLYFSSNGGTSWNKVAGNLEVNKLSGAGDGPSCRWASIIPVNNGYVYLVGTSVGLFATTELKDTGTVWVQQGANTIGFSVVNMMDSRSTDGLVVAATHSSGIFSTHIAQTGDITEVTQLTANTNSPDFMLYPNPCNTEAFLQFNLLNNDNVTLTVFDESGRLVRTIVNDHLDAGEKQYMFTPGNLPAGIYYCTLRTGERMETKRLVLTK